MIYKHYGIILLLAHAFFSQALFYAADQNSHYPIENVCELGYPECGVQEKTNNVISYRYWLLTGFTTALTLWLLNNDDFKNAFARIIKSYSRNDAQIDDSSHTTTV